MLDRAEFVGSFFIGLSVALIAQYRLNPATFVLPGITGFLLVLQI